MLTCRHQWERRGIVRVGDQELALLTFIAGHGAASVGEVAEAFGEPRGLSLHHPDDDGAAAAEAASHRRRVGGVFRYLSPRSRREVLQEAVGSFVARSLDGSLSPFTAYSPNRPTSPTERQSCSGRSTAPQAEDPDDALSSTLLDTLWRVVAGWLLVVCLAVIFVCNAFRRGTRRSGGSSAKFVAGLAWTSRCAAGVAAVRGISGGGS
jgi:hypothetical protein